MGEDQARFCFQLIEIL